MSPVLIPAIGALMVLAFDVLARPPGEGPPESRRTALSGIRLGIRGAGLAACRGLRAAMG